MEFMRIQKFVLNFCKNKTYKNKSVFMIKKKEKKFMYFNVKHLLIFKCTETLIPT